MFLFLQEVLFKSATTTLSACLEETTTIRYGFKTIFSFLTVPFLDSSEKFFFLTVLVLFSCKGLLNIILGHAKLDLH
jgi:hypothetical protein